MPVLFFQCIKNRVTGCVVPCFGSSCAQSCAFPTRPHIKRDYPLNLSILLGGGKETKKDSLSNGEWTGRSPAPNPASPRCRELWCEGSNFRPCGFFQVPLSGAIAHSGCKAHRKKPFVGQCSLRVGLLESAALIRGKSLERLNITARPIANKYREGKLQRTLKREFKRAWNYTEGNGRSRKVDC